MPKPKEKKTDPSPIVEPTDTDVDGSRSEQLELPPNDPEAVAKAAKEAEQAVVAAVEGIAQTIRSTTAPESQ